jgi:SM-20-related protein
MAQTPPAVAVMVLPLKSSLGVPLDAAAQVIQFDDALEPSLKDELVEVLSELPVFFLNRATHFKTHALDLIWYHPFAYSETDLRIEDVEPKIEALDPSLAVIGKCWQAIKALHDHPVRLYDCSLSSNTFGTEGNYHHDISEPTYREGHYTALVYCCKEWDVSWAGETLVFNDNCDIVAGAMPKSGRILIIKNDPLHVGRSVSRICPTDRRVLTFKYWRVAD